MKVILKFKVYVQLMKDTSILLLFPSFCGTFLFFPPHLGFKTSCHVAVCQQTRCEGLHDPCRDISAPEFNIN